MSARTSAWCILAVTGNVPYTEACNNDWPRGVCVYRGAQSYGQ